MKNKIFIILLLFIFLIQSLISQTPQGFNYQAVARDASGQPITDQAISIMVSILDGSASGPVLYTEIHHLSTNNLGLFSIIIGEGTTVDDFSAIDWSAGGSKWLEIQMDVTGGASYQLMGTSQLLSVPYALYAQNASNGSSQWNTISNGISYDGGIIGVGTSSPDPSAIVDMRSGSRGMLMPRLTDTQRDSINNPAVGLVIFNISTNCLNVFKQQGWWEICGNCLLPGTPIVSSNQPVCEGDTIRLFASAIAGADYHWTGPNGFTSNLQNPVIPDCVFADTGNYIVYVSNICGSSPTVNVHISVEYLPTTANAGTDQLNISGTTTTNLAANTPVYGTGLWTVVTGNGGVIADSSSPTSAFSGIADSAYILRWTISNNCGSSSDDVIITFTSMWFCGDTVTDSRDGQRYGTVQIGNQCWMSQNINIGTQITAGTNMTDNGVIEKYCYNNDPAICLSNGALYQWDESVQYDTAESAQGICPPGWHVCSDQEFKDLEIELGMLPSDADLGNTWRGSTQGTMLMIGGSSGYNALLSGNSGYGSFGLLGSYEYNWTTTESGSIYAWRRCLRAGDTRVGRWDTFPKAYAFSIRCLKD